PDRNLVAKGADLMAGTNGRGLGILDDITRLRHMDRGPERAAPHGSPQGDRGAPDRRPSGAGLSGPPSVILFKPRTAYRVRWNMNTDTPLPPDEAMGPNPPDGALINSSLQADSSVQG